MQLVVTVTEQQRTRLRDKDHKWQSPPPGPALPSSPKARDIPTGDQVRKVRHLIWVVLAEWVASAQP